MTTSEYADAGGGVTIRPVMRADLLDVIRIEQVVFPQPWPFSGFERYLDAPGFLVAEADGNRDGAEAGGAGGSPEAASPEAGGSSAGGGVVAPGAGDVVGYVVGDVVPNHGRPLGHVKDLAVRPDHQGEGIGSALLGRALRILSSRGVSTVKLEVRPSNDAALSLYSRFGFEPLKTVSNYYADGENALVMVVDLDAGSAL